MVRNDRFFYAPLFRISINYALFSRFCFWYIFYPYFCLVFERQTRTNKNKVS